MKFKIIRKRLSSILVIGGIIIFTSIALTLYFIFFDINTLNGSDFNVQKIAGIALFFIAVIVVYTSKNYIIIGQLNVDSNEFLIEVGNDKLAFQNKNVTNLSIGAYNYKGEPLYFDPKAIATKTGANNYISFTYGEVTYRYDVLLESFEELQDFKNLEYSILSSNEY